MTAEFKSIKEFFRAVTGPAELKLVMDSPKYSDSDTIRALDIKQNINYVTLKNLSAAKQISAHCIAKGFHKNFHRAVYVKAITSTFTTTYKRGKGVSPRRC